MLHVEWPAKLKFWEAALINRSKFYFLLAVFKSYIFNCLFKQVYFYLWSRFNSLTLSLLFNLAILRLMLLIFNFNFFLVWQY